MLSGGSWPLPPIGGQVEEHLGPIRDWHRIFRLQACSFGAARTFWGKRVGIGVEWRFVLASHVAAAAIYPLPTSWNLGFIYRLHEHRLREVYPNPSFIFPPTPLTLPLSLPPLLIPPSLSHAVSFLHIYFLFCLCTFFYPLFCLYRVLAWSRPVYNLIKYCLQNICSSPMVPVLQNSWIYTLWVIDMPRWRIV